MRVHLDPRGTTAVFVHDTDKDEFKTRSNIVVAGKNGMEEEPDTVYIILAKDYNDAVETVNKFIGDGGLNTCVRIREDDKEVADMPPPYTP